MSSSAERDRGSDCEDIDDEEDYEYYYSHDGDCDVSEMPYAKKDPEASDFECLTITQVKSILEDNVDTLCKSIPVSPSIAKVR